MVEIFSDQCFFPEAVFPYFLYYFDIVSDAAEPGYVDEPAFRCDGKLVDLEVQG